MAAGLSSRWVTELNERKQGAMLRKYEMLKEAQTKGNARADAAARAKGLNPQDRTKRINDLEVEIQELKGEPPKAPNSNAVPEEEKERRRVQSERDKCLALVREQAGVREALKRDMIKKGEITQKDLKGKGTKEASMKPSTFGERSLRVANLDPMRMRRWSRGKQSPRRSGFL